VKAGLVVKVCKKEDLYMRVLMVEPKKEPYETDIEHSLESMQKVVGGDIQAVYPYNDPVALVCNDNGKIEGLPLNRALKDGSGKIYDIVAGTFFIVGLSEDDFTDLSPEFMEKYRELFQRPEIFSGRFTEKWNAK